MAIILVGLCLIASAVGLVRAWRRTQGEARQQLLWLVAGALPLAPCVVASFAVSYAGHEDVAGYLMSAAIVTLAVGAALSVLRYRLYDVERVVTDSAAYAIASAAVIVSFVRRGRRHQPDHADRPQLAAADDRWRPSRARRPPGSPTCGDGGPSSGASTASGSTRSRRSGPGWPHGDADLDALLTAALHDPRRAHPLPDRRRCLGHLGRARRRPRAATSSTYGGTARHREDRVRPAAERSRAVVEAVAHEAAAEIDNVALRAELARQVELISESRSRLATAHLEERRRIERDLHDGAQQRLLAIALQLQSAQVNGATTMLRDEVDRAIAELGLTVQELRDLAGGLQPAALAGGGLLAAVVDLAGRIPLNITYDVVDQRFPPSIEGAAWFVIAEATTNAVKHAAVDDVSITRHGRAVRAPRRRRRRGQSATPTRRGRGLQGLADRVSALRRLPAGQREPAARHGRRGGAAMRVVIADDSALLREGLARLLAESGVEVCATVADAAGLADAVAAHRPDVAIVDIRMPPTLHPRGRRRRGRAAASASRPRASCCSPRPSRRTSRPSCSSGTRPTSATCSRTGSSTWRR